MIAAPLEDGKQGEAQFLHKNVSEGKEEQQGGQGQS